MLSSSKRKKYILLGILLSSLIITQPQFPSYHDNYIKTIVEPAQRAEEARQATERALAASTPKILYTPPTVVMGPVTGDVWYRLRLCESGNNYANKTNPNYRGAYQFSYATWASVGGSGDPANAPPAEQDARALILYKRSGASQWSCAGTAGLR